MWGWQSQRSEVLAEIISEFPQESWAIDEVATQLYADGKTSELESLFSKAYAKDPSNPRLKNNLANLYLLRKTELDKAYTLAKEAYDSATNNPFFASTYAYSLLLQDKEKRSAERCLMSSRWNISKYRRSLFITESCRPNQAGKNSRAKL